MIIRANVSCMIHHKKEALYSFYQLVRSPKHFGIANPQAVLIYQVTYPRNGDFCLEGQAFCAQGGEIKANV